MPNTKDTKDTKIYDANDKEGFPTLPPDVERVGKVVLDAAFKVYTILGPGLLESVYQIALKHVIETTGTQVETEVKLPITFKGVKLESGLRLGFLINFNVPHLKDGIKRIVF